MDVERVADRVVLVRCPPEIPAFRWIAGFQQAFGDLLEQVVPAYSTIGLYFRAAPPSLPVLQRIAVSLAPSPETGGRSHEIPVLYQTEPGEACRILNLDPDELAQLHASAEYTCFAVGFCPGFAYLGWLPDELSGVPRLPSPRTRTEPGSVALTGRQTAVYPLERPGGWPIIGRTPCVLVDEASGFFPIAPGDRVRFCAIDREEFEAREGKRLGS